MSGEGRAVVRGLAGALTAGLALLTLALGGLWVVTAARHEPGPRPVVLLGHALALAAAVALQRVADRRRDRLGQAAAVAVVAVFLLVGALFWWS